MSTEFCVIRTTLKIFKVQTLDTITVYLVLNNGLLKDQRIEFLIRCREQEGKLS